MGDDDAPQTIEEKFAVGLSELIGMCCEAGMHTSDMIPALEKELAWCRNPYQNPEDGIPPPANER